MISSLVFMAMGLPTQIWKIYMTKSTSGVSLFERCALLLTTLVWVWYGLTVHDRNIWIANAPGALCAFIILCQFWVYRSSAIRTILLGGESMKYLKSYGVISVYLRFSSPPVIGQRMNAKHQNTKIAVLVTEIETLTGVDPQKYKVTVERF